MSYFNNLNKETQEKFSNLKVYLDKLAIEDYQNFNEMDFVDNVKLEDRILMIAFYRTFFKDDDYDDDEDDDENEDEDDEDDEDDEEE